MGLSLNEKYYWFIWRISRGNVTLKDLNKDWVRSEANRTGKPISRRTFINMKEDINNVLGIEIKCRRRGMESYYYIDSSPGTDKTRDWIDKTMQTRNALMQSLSIKDRIVLEDIPSADVWLESIIEAVKANRLISFTYCDFWEDPVDVTIKPYFLKLFHQRWYVIGPKPDDEDSIRSYALDNDRMNNFMMLDQTFRYPENFSPEDFYHDNYGTIRQKDRKAETVRILVWQKQDFYIDSVPLHHSQTVLYRSEADGYTIFEYRLQPTYDFEMTLRSFGNDVEVLAPESLRRRMIEGAEDVLKEYRGESRATCKEPVRYTEDLK